MKKNIGGIILICALLSLCALLILKGNEPTGYTEVALFKYDGTTYHIFANKTDRGRFCVTEGMGDMNKSYYRIPEGNTKGYVREIKNQIKLKIKYIKSLSKEQKQYIDQLSTDSNKEESVLE